MSGNAYELIGLLLSAFGTGWFLGKGLRAVREFFGNI